MVPHKIFFEFSNSNRPENSSIETIRNLIQSSKGTIENSFNDFYPSDEDALPEGIFDKIQDALLHSTVVIIEGSYTSVSIGWILNESVFLNKPILYLIDKNRPSRLTRFVANIQYNMLYVKYYSSKEELEKIITDFLKNVQRARVRFNLVIPNDLNTLLEAKSVKTKTSKTEIILKYLKEALINE